MKIGNFDIDYISHVSFLFQSQKGTVILTDVLFAEGFEWAGHFERYLSPPDISLQDIKKCDAIFVSHIHGDHYDPDAIKDIHERTKCVILAPDDVLESLNSLGISEDYLRHISDGKEMTLKDVTLTTLAGYDNSHDNEKRPNKFSLLISDGQTRLFYSGDCHEVPPKLKGQNVDAIFYWPHPVDEKLMQFSNSFEFRKFVMMHGDRFEPGDFFCNMDYDEQKRRLEKMLPDVEIIIPERA